jgi:hypothetical protein
MECQTPRGKVASDDAVRAIGKTTSAAKTKT